MPLQRRTTLALLAATALCARLAAQRKITR